MTESQKEPLKSTSSQNDIAQLKQIEARLRRMTRVFMDGADPIVIRDLEGCVIDANYEVERVFGWTRDELLGQRTKQLLPPEWHELADRTMEQCRHGQAVRNVEALVRTKSGDFVPVLVTAFLLTEDGDQPVAIANIVKDITELKRTAERLEQRNREQKQFCNILAHDLSAPLHSIRGFAELLKDRYGNRLDDDADESIQSIIESVKRMLSLTGDLLNYAQLESQEKVFRPVDCSQVFQQAVANLHAAITENNAEVTCDPLPTVLGHETQLGQVFQNLLSNAIKFRRDEPPRVHVSCETGETEWSFSVRDNGIGIDNAYLNRVFDAFRRLHADGVFPGTGIGLAICSDIVQRHGGRIWVESEKGQGSVFYFTLSRHPQRDSDGSLGRSHSD